MWNGATQLMSYIVFIHVGLYGCPFPRSAINVNFACESSPKSKEHIDLVKFLGINSYFTTFCCFECSFDLTLTDCWPWSFNFWRTREFWNPFPSVGWSLIRITKNTLPRFSNLEHFTSWFLAVQSKIRNQPIQFDTLSGALNVRTQKCIFIWTHLQTLHPVAP